MVLIFHSANVFRVRRNLLHLLQKHVLLNLFIKQMVGSLLSIGSLLSVDKTRYQLPSFWTFSVCLHWLSNPGNVHWNRPSRFFVTFARHHRSIWNTLSQRFPFQAPLWQIISYGDMSTLIGWAVHCVQILVGLLLAASRCLMVQQCRGVANGSPYLPCPLQKQSL